MNNHMEAMRQGAYNAPTRVRSDTQGRWRQDAQ